jgi:hypothetical protein
VRTPRHIVVLWLLLGVLSAMLSAPTLVGKAWAQAFGMVAASVASANDPRGLTVRSEPSESAGVVGYLQIGTEIRACNDFKGSWARLQSPFPGGWVNMVNLKPTSGEGSVVAVDEPEHCLAIRKGPGSSYEKVACAALGQKLRLSGVWSENNFARIESGDWVDASKISTDLMTCDATSANQMAEVAQPDQSGTAPAPPPDYQQMGPSYSPSYDGSYAYAPSCNFGTFGLPYLFGPYLGFGFYPGWWAGPVAAAIWAAYPWRHWRGPYYHNLHPRPYGFNRAIANPNRAATAANLRNAVTNRSTFNANRAAVNNLQRSANSALRSASLNRGVRAASRNVTAFRGAGLRVGNFASGGFRANMFRGASFRAAGFRGLGRRR